MRFVLNEAEISTVVCSADTLREMVKILPECPSIRVVVLMDVALNCREVCSPFLARSCLLISHFVMTGFGIMW